MNELLEVDRRKLLTELLGQDNHKLTLRLVELHYPEMLTAVANTCLEKSLAAKEYDVAYEIASDYLPEQENNVFYIFIERELNTLKKQIFDFNALNSQSNAYMSLYGSRFNDTLDLILLISAQVFDGNSAEYSAKGEQKCIDVTQEISDLRSLRDEVIDAPYLFFEKVALAEAIERNDFYEIPRISEGIKVLSPKTLDKFNLERYTPNV